AAHYLPSYAGNLDIMTSAALATGERIAGAMLSRQGAHHAFQPWKEALHLRRDAA
ncbi:MAG: hypothetical protein ACREUE_04140, partial [Panacagrimonas sp.]